ncbi:MAG: glycosyltransferase family 4 protein [Saprospiraceae bacterium]|nr:glycosyltransferase family 4 protein [Saprospiraceae bacterium]
MSEDPDNHKQKLIIAFDAKRLFNNFTGLGNYSRTLLRNLQNCFPENEYHLFTPKIIKNEETIYFLNTEKFIIHTPKIRNPLWRIFGMAKAVNVLLPHVFHGLSHEIPFGLDKRIKTTVTFHDLIYEKFPAQFNFLDRTMYKWKYRSAAYRANTIIAISKSTKSDLILMYHINPNKIYVLYQSCHQAFQEAEMEDSIVAGPLTGLENYYLYVGSIIERKGLLSIVFAYARLQEQYRKPFVVIGKGDKKYLKKVKEMIYYHNLDEYFYFFDRISNEGLIAMYDLAFVLLYPSTYEGFGIPVIESLFRHKPVITSDISSMPEAAGPGGLLVNPYEPDDISLAMMQIHDPKVYDKLVKEGYEYVQSNFSTYQTTKKMINFYYDLVDWFE